MRLGLDNHAVAAVTKDQQYRQAMTEAQIRGPAAVASLTKAMGPPPAPGPLATWPARSMTCLEWGLTYVDQSMGNVCGRKITVEYEQIANGRIKRPGYLDYWTHGPTKNILYADIVDFAGVLQKTQVDQPTLGVPPGTPGGTWGVALDVF